MTRQDTARTAGDKGMMARWLASGGTIEAPAGYEAAADEGLQAGRFTTNPFSCADDGLRPVGPTGHPLFCADEGLQARFTTYAFTCADDGLQCSNITKGYGCIPAS